MMDSDLRHYLKNAAGDEPPLRYGDARWTETEAIARRLIETSAVEAALRAVEQEPARRKRWDLLLLTALLRQGLGDRTRSLEALEVVADKLVAAGDREGVLALLPRFLEPEASPAAVRLLHWLSRGPATDDERIAWLSEAIDVRTGDPALHAELASALERAGSAEEARDHRLRALELRVESGGVAELAEALFRSIDEDLPHDPERVGEILLRYAAKADWSDSEPILDLALPELELRAPGLLAWEDLAALGPRLPATRGARALAGRLLRLVVANEADPDAILAGARIEDPAVAFDSVAARMPKILAFPPGAYVIHQAWGLGRVAESDGETLLLDFAGREGHKMSFAMASRSLERLPAEGLRVLAIEDEAKARRMADEGNAEILVRALRDVGGTATQAQLKPRLEAAIPGYDWAAWWRKVKERWKSDARLDTSEAYHGQFRLARRGREAPAETTLPRIALRAPAEGLQLIRKFLREHPDQEPRLREHAGPLAARWAEDDRVEPALRAQALCHAAAWNTLPPERAREALDRLIEAGLAPDDLALGSNQEQLLQLSRGAADEEEFLWRAAASRLPRLREQGRSRLLALLGPERFARSVAQRVAHGAEQPGLATRLIEHYAERPGDPGAPDPEVLLLAAIRLLEGDLPQGVPERLSSLLAAKGALRERFRSAAPDAEWIEAVERTVVNWVGSERRLTPVLELLHETGHGAIVEEYERRRQSRARELLEGRTTEDVETQFTLMSRATYDRLQEELARTARDLKTSIPAAIEKARALGDLRENAEYEAAKQRQATAAARVQELMNVIQNARLIETMEIDARRVGVGTEATLRALGANGDPEMTLWILGEGDNALGPGILSYRAPLARPLLGKEIGAEVELITADGPRRYRVESIRKRLPGDPS